MHYPILTSRLSIAPLSMADLEQFVAYRQDPQIARYQSWEPNYSRAQAIGLIESQEGKFFPSDGEWLQLAIHRIDSTELIGDVAIHKVEGEKNVVELGFTISRPHQRQGFAFEAVSKLIDSLSQEAGVVLFRASSDSRNHRSTQLLLALGFRKVPEKSWTEEFKNEMVRVDFFERN